VYSENFLGFGLGVSIDFGHIDFVIGTDSFGVGFEPGNPPKYAP